jgi:hypothetical protein
VFKTVLSASVPTRADLARQIDAERDVLRETLLQSYDDIRMTLTQRDPYGECLLDHLVPLFKSSTAPQDAPLQCLLGATFASGCGDVHADPVLAAEFFELAARHAQRGSYAGLGKLLEEGQAGLDVNISEALGTYQQGAIRGDDAALTAMSALAVRLAAEHAAALKSVNELEQRGTHDAPLRVEATHGTAQEQRAATHPHNARKGKLGRLRTLFGGRHQTSRR